MEITIKINIGTEELKELLGQHDKKRPVCNSNISPYARVFDEKAAGWTKDPEVTKFFLLRQQDYANEKLKVRGYLFLNEVLDMLGIPRTKAGQVMGWVYDEAYPVGDNYVDFGIFKPHNHDFVNGYEKSCLLNFNVDGDILSRM